MVSPSKSVLFLGKRNDASCAKARAWCQAHFGEVVYLEGAWREPFPASACSWQGDLILSYLSRWVVPAQVLARARVAAINFHPGPPEYPGIGCTNFALYDDAPTYGATCHHMAPAVDTGDIIDVIRFETSQTQTVDALLKRTYVAMEALFERVMSDFVQSGRFAQSPERWTRPVFSRAQFNALCEISPEMSAQEVAKRVRATDYPPYGPHLVLHGHRFKLDKGAQ